LQTMHVLASALFRLNKPEKARDLLEELLPILKRVLGPEHPKTHAAMGNLALTWWNIGNLEKAKELYEQDLAVELRERPSHPGTLGSMNNLAVVYEQLGQIDRVTELRRRVMEGRLRVLGLAHPHTKLAIALLYQGVLANSDRTHWEEARKTLEPILEQSRRE